MTKNLHEFCNFCPTGVYWHRIIMILNFILHNWPDIILSVVIFLLATLPIFPPICAGLRWEFYDFNQKKMVKQKWLNLFETISNLIAFTIIQGPILSISFSGTVTLLLFIAIGADLYFNKKITNNAVILVVIGILALYFDKILDISDEITVWKLFSWKSKKNNAQPTVKLGNQLEKSSEVLLQEGKKL